MTHPVTTGQAAMWFADQYGEPNCAYSMPIVAQADHALSDAEVRTVIDRLVDSTPTLRVRMGLDSHGDVVQWFDPSPPLLDWAPPPEDPSDVEPAVRPYVLDPLDVDAGALVKFVVVRPDRDRTVVTIIIHHLLNDGIGHILLGRRLAMSFTRALPGGSQKPYLDLVDRVRGLERDAERDHTGYWQDRLAGLSEVDWAGAPRKREAAGSFRAPVPALVASEVRDLAARLEISRFFVFMGMLHRTLGAAGHRESVICTAASLRPPDDSTDEVAGFFVNQVPLRCSHEDGESLTDLLRREAPRWRADLRRRTLPLMTMANACAPTKLDRVLTSYRNSQGEVRWSEGGLRVYVDLFNRYYEAKTDLSVRFVPQGDDLEFEAEWAAATPPGLGADFAEDFAAALASMPGRERP